MSMTFPVTPITDIAMPALMVRIPLRKGSIGHVVKGIPYFLGNSFRGVRAMARAHKRWADRDVHLTKDLVKVITHWGQPLMHGFIDPLGKIAKHTQIEDMTWEQVSRLEAHYKGLVFKIRRLEDDMRECAKAGIWPKYEPKTKRLARVDLWIPVKALELELRKKYAYRGKRRAFRISGYVLLRNRACRAPMRAAGIPTSLINRW